MDWKRVPPGTAGCCRVLWDAGYEAYPVGGCVRDLLLGREPGDWDVTTSAPPERVMELFERTVPTGIRHGTVTVLLEGESMEVTTFRREEGYADGRHPDTVRFDATLEEDLSRRDFTINAMALARDGGIVDPFGGQADLEGRRIRCVGEPDRRFSEDALRMFRAVRFAAQLGFLLDEDIVPSIRQCAPLADCLASERVRVEVEKTLLSPRPDRAGDFFELGLMPSLPACRPEGVTQLGRLPARPLLRWAGLCACLERSGMVEEEADFLSGLRLEGRVIRACAGGGALWRAGLPRDDRAWRHALAEHGEPACRAGAAMGVVTGAEGALAVLERVLAQRPCVAANELAVTGGDLAGMGLRGREIGAAQARMLALVLDRPEENERERLLAFLKDARFVKAEGDKAGKNETEPCIFDTMQYN